MADTLLTIFEAKGVSSLLSAFGSVSLAESKYASATTAFNRATTSGQSERAYLRLGSATKNLITSNLGVAAAAGTAFAAIVIGAKDALKAYVEFGNQVMNLRDLTGSSDQSAVQATMLARAAGMPDATALREVMRLSKASMGGSGAAGLSMLGISANSSAQGMDLFNQIADRLQGMQSSMRKTAIEEQIFGARGVAALQPLLRLTKDQREEVAKLSTAFGTDGLKSIQEFQFQSNLLGMTFQQQVIFPLARSFMPVAKTLITIFDKFADVLGFINYITFGWAGGLGVVALTLTAVGAGVLGIVRLTRAFSLWKTEILQTSVALKVLNRSQNIKTYGARSPGAAWAGAETGSALGGPLGALLGVGLALLVDGIASAFSGGSSGSSNPVVNQFAGAVDKFESSVQRMGDGIEYLRGKAIPSGMGGRDFGALERQMALGAIG